MARKKPVTRKRSASKPSKAARPGAAQPIESPQSFLAAQLTRPAAPAGFVSKAKVSADDITERLRELDIQPTVSTAQLAGAINRIKKEPKQITITIGSGVSAKDLQIFTRQLATMIDAGLPLVQCLDILANQTPNKIFARILSQVKASVEQGKVTDLFAKVSVQTPFEGSAKVQLVGLPPKATAPDVEITKDTKEIAFKVTADPASPAGQHKNIFCQAVIVENGEPILHAVGGTELRIDVPLPPKPDAPPPAAAVAAAKPPEPAAAPAPASPPAAPSPSCRSRAARPRASRPLRAPCAPPAAQLFGGSKSSTGLPDGSSSRICRPPGPDSTVEVHLPETLLGVDESLGEYQVWRGFGIDMRDTPLVAEHFYRRGQSLHAQSASIARSGLSQHPVVRQDCQARRVPIGGRKRLF